MLWHLFAAVRRDHPRRHVDTDAPGLSCGSDPAESRHDGHADDSGVLRGLGDHLGALCGAAAAGQTSSGRADSAGGGRRWRRAAGGGRAGGGGGGAGVPLAWLGGRGRPLPSGGRPGPAAKCAVRMHSRQPVSNSAT